ncbi:MULTISPECIES: hypothetical protein [unclassified Erwinia]|nr:MULTISPECIES: hypothetical protein [unclassified Erwinia]
MLIEGDIGRLMAKTEKTQATLPCLPIRRSEPLVAADAEYINRYHVLSHGS